MTGLPNIFDSIANFLSEMGRVIGFNYLMYGVIVLFLALILFSFLATKSTYELKLLKTVRKLNLYFKKNPTINNDNLIEFNSRMKRVPKTIRTGWQEFMLEREGVPSNYINTTTCVDRPSRGSGYANTVSATGILVGLLAVAALLIGVSYYNNDAVARFGAILFMIIAIPAMVILLGGLFVVFLKFRHSAIVSDVYYEFAAFEKNIDKACKTLPMYVDYELLFTAKEIKKDIPVLQAYLDKREELEKREALEKELNQAGFEKYDFDDLGLDNALLLERAMKESEKYIRVKNDLESKIRSKEDEMFNYEQSFEEETKTFERKAQARRETIEQLGNQINNTTISAEATFLRTRQRKEQEQLQIIEGDYEKALTKFERQQTDIQAVIEDYKGAIEDRKQTVEAAMKEQAKTYANKIYGIISKTVMEQNTPYLEKLEEEKQDLIARIESLTTQHKEIGAKLAAKESEYEQQKSDLAVKLAEVEALRNVKDYFTSEAFLENVSDVKTKQATFDKLAQENTEIKIEMSRIAKDREILAKQIEAYKAQFKKVAGANPELNAEIQKRMEELSSKEKLLSKKTSQMEESALRLKENLDSLSLVQKQLNEKEKMLGEKEKQLQDTMTRLNQTKVDIDSSRKELIETKRKVETTKKDLEKTQKMSAESRAKLERLKNITSIIETETAKISEQQKEFSKTTIPSPVKPVEVVKAPRSTPRKSINSSLNNLIASASKIKKDKEEE